MTVRIALLRGMNVGGKTKVSMAAPKAMAAELGWSRRWAERLGMKARYATS